MTYDPHIQRDFDVIAPFFRAVVDRITPISPLTESEILDHMDVWRSATGREQTSTMLNIAAEGSENIGQAQDGMQTIDGAALARLKTMDRSSITTGPCTRMIVGLSENFEDIGVTQQQTRRALNQAAQDVGSNVRELLPELLPFMQGQSQSAATFLQ